LLYIGGSGISADNVGGRCYRPSLIILKFGFAYQPIFKKSNTGRYYRWADISVSL